MQRFTIVTFIALVSACQRPPEPTPSPLTLEQLMEQVHFAWRAEPGGWETAHTTWHARHDGRALSFRPSHHARGSRIDGPALEFGRSLVARGERVLEDRGAPALEASGALRIDHGAWRERWTASADGLEQAWHFEQLPGGEGPLVVRVGVDEARFAGQTGPGLHFRAGALLVRYGHGTWVDAQGARTAIPVVLEGAQLVLRVPEDVLARSVFPAVLDPLISPEFDVDALAFGPPTSAQLAPASASDGAQHLVVWSDARLGGSAIYATRVGATGTPLDQRGGILISPTGASPDVVWNGASYFVVWVDGSRIVGARVSATGALLDATPLALSTNTTWSHAEPAIAWNGAQHLVVWSTSASSIDLEGRRISATGQLLDTTELTITAAAGDQTQPAVTALGAGFLVAWTDLRAPVSIAATRVSAQGVVDPLPLTLTTTANLPLHPAAATDGTNALVAWDAFAVSDTRFIYARRVSASGALLDAAPFALGNGSDLFGDVDLAWSGTHYFAAWGTNPEGASSGAFRSRDIRVGRVTPAGVALEPTGQLVGTGSTPTLSISATGPFVAWSSEQNALRGTPVSAAALPPPDAGVDLALVTNSHLEHAVSWSGDAWLVAWVDQRATGVDLHAARVSDAGVVLDAQALSLESGAGTPRSPALAWNGSSWLAAWLEGNDVRAARIAPAGTVLDVPPLTLGTTQQALLVALESNGADTLAAWSSPLTGAHAARVSSAGALLDATPISLGGAFVFDLAWTGADWLLVGTTGTDVRGRRVTPAGAPVGTEWFVIADTPELQLEPRVASSPDAGSFVVWADARNGNLDVRGARVTSSGAVVDDGGLPLIEGATDERWPDVSWDGRQWLVAWTHRLAGGDALEASRVRTDGTVRDASPLALSSSQELRPLVSCSSTRRCLALGLGHTRGPQRVSARVLDTNESPRASAQTLTTPEDTALALTLAGADDDGDALTFSVLSPPPGTLLGAPPQLTWTPPADFHGSASLRFAARDELGLEAQATVSLTVTPVNDAPRALAQTVTTPRAQPATFTLAGDDVDGDALTFTIGTPPSRGTLEGSGATFTFVPAADFEGTDALTFSASDGVASSAPATVQLVVTAAPTGGGGGATGGGGGSTGGGGGLTGGGSGSTGGGGEVTPEPSGCGCTSLAQVSWLGAALLLARRSRRR